MSFQCCFPKTLTAGDSIDALIVDPVFQSPEWSGKFVIGTPTPASFDLTEEAPNFRLTAAPEATAPLKFGRYSAGFVWSKEGERLSRRAGEVLILPDPTLALPQTFEMRALANAEEAMLKLSTNTNSQVQVDGQIYTKRNFADLVSFRDRMFMAVAAQLAAIGRPTTGGWKTIQTRFG